MTLYIPVGIPGSGKSTLGAKYFTASEIVNPDAIRKVLTDSEADQSCNGLVFEIAHKITQERLKRGLDVYFDATNLDPQRWPTDVSDPTIIIMSTTQQDCYHRNENRDRIVPEHAMERMTQQFFKIRRSFTGMSNVIMSHNFTR